MGFEPIVHCRNCDEPLDVFVPREERFCCHECADDYIARNVGQIREPGKYAPITNGGVHIEGQR